MMRRRRDHRDLIPDERHAFVSAVHRLKSSGAYDRYVAEYRRVFEAGGPARLGPASLPWHREFLYQFELDLRATDPTVSLPYWDWTSDGSGGSVLWSDGFLGGAGAGPETAVISGPFGLDTWVLTETSPPVDCGPALRRTLGPTPALPTSSQLDAVLRQVPYERFAASLDQLLRSSVAAWVGRTMASATAPNDPAFWLHVCNVDRMWTLWQDRHPEEAPYLEAGRGPLGHRLDDTFTVADRTIRPRDLLNHRSLGYGYDSDLPDGTVLLAVGASPLRSAIESPDEPDHYQFVAATTGTYVIEVAGAPDATLWVFGPDDPSSPIARREVGGQGSARVETHVAAGTYLLRVIHGDTGPEGGAYTVAVRAAPSRRPVAHLSPEGPVVEGHLEGDAAQSDVYAFVVTRPATYVVEIGRTGGVYATLFGPNCPHERVAVEDRSGPGQPTCTVVDLASGLYYLHVRPYAPECAGVYTVAVREASA